MVTKYLALQPLPSWVRPEHGEIATDLSIRSLDAEDRPSVDLWKDVLSGEEIRRLGRTPAWLVLENLDEAGKDSSRGQHADQTLWDASIALKGIAPLDMPIHATILCDRQHDETLHPTSIIRHQSFTSIGWARVAGYDRTNWEEIKGVCHSVEKAIVRNITRIINPLRLLGHGLASDEPRIGLLLFVAGLDALLMACKPSVFEKRLCNLLGPETLIFPEIDLTEFGQPKYTVADLAKDIYEFRSLIAHGKKIPPKYWRPSFTFEDVEGNPITGYQNIETYGNLLHESSLLVLCMALRTVLSGDVDLVEDTAKWRRHLDAPRRRRSSAQDG